MSIRWKGYPHRFPRIRLASPPQASFHATAPHIAAQTVFNSPLSPILEEARENQRVQSRRIKRHSTASLKRARKRASKKTRQDIQVFGWDSPRAMDTSTESVGSETSGTVINWSHDGDPAPSKPAIPKAKNHDRDNIYSSTQVTERRVQISKAGKVKIDTSRESAHKRPIEPGSGKEPDILSTMDRRRAYDPRITLKKPPLPSVKASPAHKPLSRRASRLSSTSSRSNRRVVQSSAGAKVRQKSSKPPVRDSKDQKKLNGYIKELELYIQASKALPNRRLVPSYSPTTQSSRTVASIHTIQALKPYQNQFESAGLAVTSADQLRLPHLPSLSLSTPPTPPKDQKWRQLSALDSPRSDQDRTDNQQKLETGSASSGRTDGASDPNRTQQPSPRKSLPWLKKRDSILITSHVPETEAAEEGKERAKSETPSNSSEILTFSPVNKGTSDATFSEVPTRPPPIPPKNGNRKFRKAQILVNLAVQSAAEAETRTPSSEDNSKNAHGVGKESTAQPDRPQLKSDEKKFQEAQLMLSMINESLEASTMTPRSKSCAKQAEALVDRIINCASQSALGDRSVSSRRPRVRRKLLGRQRRPYSNQATPVTADDLDWVDDLEEVVSDMDIIKGLRIATSAASDEETSTRIKFTTGIDLRKFLADLTFLEGFCDGQRTEDCGPRHPRGKKHGHGCDSIVYIVEDRHNHCKYINEKPGFAAGNDADLGHVPAQSQKKIRELNETVDKLAKWKAVKATEGYGAGGCGAEE
ncbi:hypothetical protein PVAG01_10849 [Phlyctema vagabunda]|uniref:Uncharacterized protein n=1 Tax=Phlyctema vagabunda TaxID=108571 RepID=A0ABR4P3F3_9HELO